MPITPTYPGLYIEELASNARVIAAAPTSITVFVGYTHPFKTKNFKKAVRVFSMAEFEREFGGLFASGVVDVNTPHAVNQFFLNGGSDAYVVGLEPRARGAANANLGAIPRGSATVGGAVFSALELTDLVGMNVTVDNLTPDSKIADITIAYGSRAETYRAVDLVSTSDNFIEKRINGLSALATVAPGGGGYGATFTAGSRVAFTQTMPVGFLTSFAASDFTDAFAADTSLDKVRIFNLLVMPGITDTAVWSSALSFCERKHAFAILDPPRQAAADDSLAPVPKIADLLGSLPKSTNGALYFPYLNTPDPITGTTIELPPSGSVAGLYARIDQNRGVWKSPAGLEATLNNTIGVVDRGVMTDIRHGLLNPLGVNAIRSFPGIGTVVFGARTQTSENPAFQQWRYIAVRRTALFLEQTLLANLGWVVFEGNDERLWVAIRTSIENFMLSLFNQGAFQGTKPSSAFKVICDSTTTTQTDIDLGIVNVIVAFAPLKPAEFVIIKIAQLAGQAQ